MCNIELWVNAISVKWRHLVASKYFHSIIVEQGVHLIQISSQYEVFLLMSEYVGYIIFWQCIFIKLHA